jgi:hypothetical protein
MAMIARNGCTSSHRIQRKHEHIEDGFGAFVVNVAKMESGCALTLRLPINLQTFCSEKGHLLPNIRTSVKGDLMTDRILNKMHISHVSKDMALDLRVYRLLLQGLLCIYTTEVIVCLSETPLHLVCMPSCPYLMKSTHSLVKHCCAIECSLSGSSEKGLLIVCFALCMCMSLRRLLCKTLVVRRYVFTDIFTCTPCSHS